LSNPGLLRDSAISLSAQNLFDRDPPVVLTANGAQFDANNANVYGRIVQLNVMKKF
jgi:iron complex outermembrane receptor protein